MTNARKKGHEHQCSGLWSSLQGRHPAAPGAGNPRVLGWLCTVPSAGLTFTGCQKFLVLLGGVGLRELQNSPPCPLGSTRHSGSSCMSSGSSAGCTGSGLLRCCCGHTDSPHVGGKGRRCGASSRGSGDAPYCSGPPL